MENLQINIKNVGGVVPELSRPITVTELEGNCLTRQIIANDEECTKLAKRFDLIELKSFSANVKISSLIYEPIVFVEGKLNAKVIQQCVVTLEPVANNISCVLSCKYSEMQKILDAESVEFDVMTEDPPELIVDGQFDIGILLTEYFGLELDPFPRSLGAIYDKTDDMVNMALGSSNPFDVLKKLK